jgi:beta-glucuronidase
VADAALGHIETLVEKHPEIGWKLEGAKFKITNGADTDTSNDIFVIDPGHWVRAAPAKDVNLAAMKIINQRGLGKVRLVQFENKQWQLQVDGKPFVVRGITYAPTPVGQHINDYGNRWMFDDSDENGKPDAPYDAWVDTNRNGRQDDDEPAIGDFELLRRMNCNAIRIYRNSNLAEYDPGEFNKDVMRDLTQKYGIRIVMGDFLGAYTKGSGATWEEGTDYTNPVQLENMKRVVKAYVEDHRAEPYVLMWLLGNENLMPADFSGVNATRTKASRQVAAYLKFVDEVAQMIHQLDPDHPVAVGNLDLVNLDDYATYAPNVDIFGANAYRGMEGFGTLWKKVSEAYDRPVLITEYGCDAYDSRKNAEDEKTQALYHAAAWEDIARHVAGGPYEGNAIGGMIFEYLDEWWKSPSGALDAHDTSKDTAMAVPDGWSSEEWDGIMSQGDGGDSPFLRVPRQAYELYRDKLWAGAK